MDDWPFFPQQFPSGSVYDLREAGYATPRLYGLKSVKNMQGGLVRPLKDETRRVIGFHIPKPDDCSDLA